MSFTFIPLILTLIFSIWDVCNLIHTNKVHFDRTNWINIIVVTVTGPIAEECVFRHTLLYFTQHLPYYIWINIIAFAGLHFTNYFYFTKTTFRESCVNVVIAGIVGYYIINLNNLVYAILAHICWNSIIIWSAIFYQTFVHKKPEITVCQEYITQISGGKLRRTRSFSDIKKEKTNVRRLTKVPNELQYMYDIPNRTPQVLSLDH